MLFSIDSIHGGSNYRIKDREKALVFHKLCVSHNNTRKMIALNLGLRPITISKITKELIEDNLVFEGDSKERNSKGRPEIELLPNYYRFSAISLYVVSREITGTLVTMNGEVLFSTSILVSEEADNQHIKRDLKKILSILIKKVPPQSELAGIGASLPGTVHTNEGLWVSSARWPAISNISFSEIISGYSLPFMLYRYLDPELEFLLLKNSMFRKGGTLLFHWGYGIGSSYALDGRILTSTLGRFGEIGHWKITPDSDKKCRCGLYGCLETEAALWALLPDIRTRYPDAPEDEPEFTLFMQKNNIRNLPVVKKALFTITTSLANLYKVFYPDRILFIGPFTEDPEILEELKRDFMALIPEYAVSAVNLRAVSGFEGFVEGSVYHLFRDALRPLLKTRANV